MEGLQAARAADFAISQFRFLKKLLLVHGSWAYSRLSKLILYSFYKNLTLYLTQFWVKISLSLFFFFYFFFFFFYIIIINIVLLFYYF